MTIATDKEYRFGPVEDLLGYFDQQVLAAYRNESQKYIVKSDNFHGELRTTEEYYRESEEAGKTHEYVRIRFGYRTLKDGNLAIVAWLPDLQQCQAHVRRWAAFQLEDPEWTTGQDERFSSWAKRYLEGSWEVDNGPSYYLAETIKIINGLTNELANVSLYKRELNETLSYPSAENTHRYQDAHTELYGYLIDGLNKECISRLANKLGRNMAVGDKKTLEALTQLFPELRTKNFTDVMDLVSGQRRLATHSVRDPSRYFPAFEQFTKDLYRCLAATREVLAALEGAFGMNGQDARKRHEARESLPTIVRPPEADYSIVKASRMVGKTVEKVEFGFCEKTEGLHQSEALLIYFTDGSIMGLQTGSNVWNFVNSEDRLREEDFHVDFIVDWVPELPAGKEKKP